MLLTTLSPGIKGVSEPITHLGRPITAGLLRWIKAPECECLLYLPDEDGALRGPLAEEDGENEAQTEEERSEKTSPGVSEDRELDNKSTNTDSNQNSPGSVLSNQEAELESRLSDGSDRLSDFKNASPPESRREDERRGSRQGEEAAGSLEKMRAAYANFLSDSYWTGLGTDLKVGKTTSRANCDSTNGSARNEFDWHQDALSKTLQQTAPPKPAPKPNLFSSVHLYRQTPRPCGSVFTGASRFRCKDCSAAYDTLVALTVHMNKSGHYRDNNHGKQSHSAASSSKSRKRTLQDADGKEDVQKVLKCMFCGHAFDSLQDLSVHMIKTKHYQKVPLKEPIITHNLPPPAKKRTFETARPCSPDSTTGVAGYADAQRAATAHNNRYGYQNGASYTWQFETCKSQILKCMECGSSHDTLQQLTTHMMVTGHFIKVTTSASKKGKQLALDPLAMEKIQVLAEPAEGDKVSQKSAPPGSSDKERQEGPPDKMDDAEAEDEQKAGAGPPEYPYLREEDLEQDSGGGGDILKSLANTVASAITKAQTGTPTWSAYPSIHAAYQLSGIIDNTPPPSQVKPTFNHKLRPIAPKGRFYPGAAGAGSPQGRSRNVDIKKEMVAISDGKESQNAKFDLVENDDEDSSSSSKLDGDCLTEGNEAIKGKSSPDFSDRGKTASPSTADGPAALGLNPLSALQSVLNNHLGKANRPNSSGVAKPSIYASVRRSGEKPALLLGGALRSRPGKTFVFMSNGQPMDLTKSNHKQRSGRAPPASPRPQKHALSDIADMVKVLPKAATPNGVPPTSLQPDASAEVYAVHKRKGRQSNWNPRHLLVLQAQFASSLFQTSEGKYLLADLGPQERTHISKFTGLSMTTISHWLANVKYQLRKTGGTKFLKNMDAGRPVFYCNDCASQFRSPAAFISHLESHLGFQIKDMCRMPVEHQKLDEPEPSQAAADEDADADADARFKCKLCCRTFASNHAVKLHLSKTHSKSPDSHSQYVEMDE
ncbi:teashirt homolog 2 [Brachionichthys hirsutus]|uniref:teashirt homolog 2 n=1 Tax=Brachionichthys hirsutus TaxID=412623 RepID=UPI0036053985